MGIINTLVTLLASLPHEVAVFLLAMIPVGELRAAIPVGLTVYDMSVVETALIAIAGNIVPALAIYFLIGPVSRLLCRYSKQFSRFFEWLVNRTRAKFQSQRYAKYELLGLIVFIGIPLPMTGAWTGALAAWLFALKPRYAIVGFVAGLIMSATIVTAITQGVISLG